MLTHKQKTKIARKTGMRTREEKSTKFAIRQPRGGMISRLFSTRMWWERKESLKKKSQKHINPKNEDLTKIVEESKIEGGSE